MDTGSIESIVFETIHKVAAEDGLQTIEVHRNQSLVRDIGFKSIDLARLIAILELRLDVDPFSKTVAITSIHSVGDLCDAYALCLEQGGAAPLVPGHDSQGALRKPVKSDVHRRNARKRAREGF